MITLAPNRNPHSRQNRSRSIRLEDPDNRVAVVVLRAATRPRQMSRRQSSPSKARSKVACSWRRPPDRLILTEGDDFKRDTFATSHRKFDVGNVSKAVVQQVAHCYSITSSARASHIGGTSRPSALRSSC